jgi:hypothetical protein
MQDTPRLRPDSDAIQATDRAGSMKAARHERSHGEVALVVEHLSKRFGERLISGAHR